MKDPKKDGWYLAWDGLNWDRMLWKNKKWFAITKTLETAEKELLKYSDNLMKDMEEE